MLGIVENLVGESRFHHLTVLHHHLVMGEEADHADIVGDQKITEVEGAY